MTRSDAVMLGSDDVTMTGESDGGVGCFFFLFFLFQENSNTAG